VVTVNGEAVAVIRPLSEEDQEAERRRAIDEWLARVEKTAAEIGKHWPPGVSAAEAVAEQRRKL
jgi:antitoxin (DNA-binding transcriptional repressor) of toxin-antitoxin stability system